MDGVVAFSMTHNASARWYSSASRLSNTRLRKYFSRSSSHGADSNNQAVQLYLVQYPTHRIGSRGPGATINRQSRPSLSNGHYLQTVDVQVRRQRCCIEDHFSDIIWHD